MKHPKYPNWFQKKWGRLEEVSIDLLQKRLSDLETAVKKLEEKYSGALADIKRLEEENIETSNCLYELSNQIEAVDARIDILVAEPYTTNQFTLGDK